MSCPTPDPCVEDFDSRSVPADVSYCPKSNFASPEAPVARLDRERGVGFRWHSACSFFRQAAETKTASDNNKKSEETLLHKQASKRPIDPAKAGFFLACNPSVGAPV